jgi:hypothetical protein
MLNEMSKKEPEAGEGPSIFDKITNIDGYAKGIYKEVLDKSEGLNSRGGKMEVYQFDQDAGGITVRMMNDEA